MAFGSWLKKMGKNEKLDFSRIHGGPAPVISRPNIDLNQLQQEMNTRTMKSNLNKFFPK